METRDARDAAAQTAAFRYDPHRGEAPGLFETILVTARALSRAAAAVSVYWTTPERDAVLDALHSAHAHLVNLAGGRPEYRGASAFAEVMRGAAVALHEAARVLDEVERPDAAHEARAHGVAAAHASGLGVVYFAGGESC